MALIDERPPVEELCADDAPAAPQVRRKLGGISTGAPVIMRVAVKPTATIASKQVTEDEHGAVREIEVGGRHDPCIVPRAVPVIEAMAALVILDAWEVQLRLNPEWAAQYPLC